MSERKRAWWRRGVWAWLIGLACALVVGPVVGLQPVHSEAASIPPSGDRVTAAVAALRTQHFYVAPEVRHLLTADQQKQIAETLDRAKVPAYLVFWASGSDAGYEIEADALDQIMRDVGVDGHYAIIDDRHQLQDDARGPGLRGVYAREGGLQQRLAPALLDYADTMAQAPPPTASERNEKPFDYWGGRGGGFAAGALFAVLSYGGLLLVVWLLGIAWRKVR